MKSINTNAVERAMSRQEMPEDPLAPQRASAVEQLGAPVVDAALFSRRITEFAQTLADWPFIGGPLAQLALRKYQQVKAGGLPPHFLLVVTTDEVIALERKIKMSTRDGIGVPGPEVARWRRADLQVDATDKGYYLNVTIRSPDEDEEVRCTVSKITATEDFVALLGDPSRQSPAVQFPVAAA